MSAKLAAQTQKTAGIPNGMRTAVVAAVSGAAVTINVSGGLFSSGVGVLSSYSPNVGDVVAVFRQDSSWLIIGTMGGSAGARVATGIMSSDATAGTYASETGILTVVAPLVVGRRYSLTAQVRCSSGTAAAGALYRVREDSAGGTSNCLNRFTMDADSAGIGATLYGEYTAVATGNKTFVLTIMQRPVPATPPTLTPRNPSWLYVDELVL